MTLNGFQCHESSRLAPLFKTGIQNTCPSQVYHGCRFPGFRKRDAQLLLLIVWWVTFTFQKYYHYSCKIKTRLPVRQMNIYLCNGHSRLSHSCTRAFAAMRRELVKIKIGKPTYPRREDIPGHISAKWTAKPNMNNLRRIISSYTRYLKVCALSSYKPT